MTALGDDEVIYFSIGPVPISSAPHEYSRIISCERNKWGREGRTLKARGETKSSITNRSAGLRKGRVRVKTMINNKKIRKDYLSWRKRAVWTMEAKQRETRAKLYRRCGRAAASLEETNNVIIFDYCDIRGRIGFNEDTGRKTRLKGFPSRFYPSPFAPENCPGKGFRAELWSQYIPYSFCKLAKRAWSCQYQRAALHAHVSK